MRACVRVQRGEDDDDAEESLMIRFVSLRRNEILLNMNVRRYPMRVYVYHRMLGNHMYREEEEEEERKKQRGRLCKFSLFSLFHGTHSYA